MVSQPVMTTEVGKAHRVLQALDGGDRLALEDDPEPIDFMPSTPIPFLHEHRQDELLEAAVVGIHHVERHLHGVEGELVVIGRLQHREVNRRVLVPGEADEAQLAGLLRVDERLDAAAAREAALGIVRADHLVDLHEIDHVDAHAPQ